MKTKLAAEAQLDALEPGVADAMGRRLAIAAEDISYLQDALSSAEASLSSVARDRESAVAAFEARIAIQSDALKDFRLLSAELTERVHNLTARLAEQGRTNADLSHNLQEYRLLARKLTERVKELDAKSIVNAELQNKAKEHRLLSVRVKDLEAELSEKVQENKSLQEIGAGLQAQIADLHRQLAEERTLVRDRSKEIAALEQSNRKLTTERDKLRRSLDETRSQLEATLARRARRLISRGMRPFKAKDKAKQSVDSTSAQEPADLGEPAK